MSINVLYLIFGKLAKVGGKFNQIQGGDVDKLQLARG